MMNRSTLDSIVPAHKKGKNSKMQITASCYSVAAASKLYEYLKRSLVDVNSWTDFKPGISFHPKLADVHRQYVGRIARPGDLLKIILPRWRGGAQIYDWRKIIKIEERLSGNTEIFFMTFIPDVNPEDTQEHSHFLRKESSVTFFIIRDEHKINLEVYVRNEGLNFRAPGFRIKLKAAVMGIFLASGFYNIQWMKLMKAILRYGMLQLEISN